VSTDKHQGPKKGPSTRRRQRKKSSGDENQKRPTTWIFFFSTGSGQQSAKPAEQNGNSRAGRTGAGRGQNGARPGQQIETGTGSTWGCRFPWSRRPRRGRGARGAVSSCRPIRAGLRWGDRGGEQSVRAQSAPRRREATGGMGRRRPELQTSCASEKISPKPGL
jgi:hypothetical protein